MKLNKIVKELGHNIKTPKGIQLLAGLQIAVLVERGKSVVYPDSISLLCWSKDGGQYHHFAIDCEPINKTKRIKT